MKHRNNLNQYGLVSLVVTMILAIVLSLITVSFALVSRREQRRSLDRQLSTQAYYAAESGVNEAINKLNTDATWTGNPNCSGTSTIGTQDLGSGLSYTCVLVDKAPKSLLYSSVGTTDSTIVRLESDTSITKIRISWQASSYAGAPQFVANTTAIGTLPKTPPNDFSGGSSTGVLRASIIPLTSPITRTNLITNSRTVFLYPKQAASPSLPIVLENTAAADINGKFVDGQCHIDNSPTTHQRYCNAEITVPSGTLMYLRLKSVYKDSDVAIRAYDSGGAEVKLKNAQAVIDSTGKANDVLRRVEARIPLGSSYYYPEFGVETQNSLCKLLDVSPVSGNTTDTCASATSPYQY